MGRLFLKLSPEQRNDMTQRGFNPLNDEHVDAYLNGMNRPNQEMMQEAFERIGGEKVFQKKALPLGVPQRAEREVDVSRYVGMEGAGGVDYDTPVTRENARQRMMESMESYGTGLETNRNYYQSNRRPMQQQRNIQIDPVIEQKAVEMFNNLKMVLNRNTNDLQSWAALYKSLKNTLEDIIKAENKQGKLDTLNDVRNDFLNSI